MPRETSSAIGGSSRITSQPVYSRAERAARPKPAPRWGRALLQNLEDFARGVGPGLLHLGKSLYNDQDRILGNVLPFNDAKSFMLDDVGKAIASDYKSRYGSWSKFKEGVATRPLDFLLDVATVATLGAGAVVTAPAKFAVTAAKLGGAGARTGEALLASSRALRAAGYVPATERNVLRASQVYGAASKEARLGEQLGIVRGVREIGTKAAREGRIKKPLLRPRKTNPLLHTRDEIVERALGSTPALLNAPVVGVRARAAAQGRKAPMLQRYVLERQIDTAQKRLQWLNKQELTAWAVLHQASGDAMQFLENQRRMLDASASRLDGFELELNRARRAMLDDETVVRQVQDPSPRIVQAVEATQALADDVMQPIMENVVGMRRSDLYERRLLPERVAEGARATREHPTDLQPTRRAEEAGRAAQRAAAVRERKAARLEAEAARLRDRAQKPTKRQLNRAEQLEAQAARLREQPGGVERRAAERGGRLDEVPVERMSAAERAAAGEVMQPAGGSARAGRMLARLQASREAMAERMRDLALRLEEELAAQKQAVADLRAAKGRTDASMRERAMSREEALKDAPDRVRTVPEPGDAPTPEQVEQMFQRMRKRLTTGQYGKARKQLEAWVASVYNEARYGSRNPTPEMRRAEAAAVAKARAARKRGKDKRRDVAERGQVDRAIDRYGAWSSQVARLADDAGPQLSREYWRMVRNARAADGAFANQYPNGSLERSLAKQGFHPTDRELNPTDAFDEVGDVVAEWIGENVGDASVADIALGAVPEGGYVMFDEYGAQALLEYARRGDPALPSNPTDDQVARGIGVALTPDDAAADLWTQKQTVEHVVSELLLVFENGAEFYRPASFGKHRSPMEDAIARELGILDADQGVVPDGEAWAQAIIDKLEGFGFDPEYRELAEGVRSAQMLYANEGAWAFRGERWVPDPNQTDFGTVLEFVPGISPATIEALTTRSRALTSKERATLRSTAQLLRREAKRLDKPSDAERLLRKQADQVDVVGVENPLPAASPEAQRWQRMAGTLRQQRLAQAARVQAQADRLRAAATDTTRYDRQVFRLERQAQTMRDTPTPRERMLLERAQQMEALPLRGNLAPDGSAYRPVEFVNPATGQLYRDETGAVLTAPAGSYLPHTLPRTRGISGGGRHLGSVKNKPGVSSTLTKTSTGELFAAGTYENEAIALLDRARALVRAQYASDLFDVAIRDMGIPFDEVQYARLGGPREWVVANPAQLKGVTDRVEALAGQFEELGDLLPEEQLTEAVRRLHEASQSTLGEATKAGTTDQLLMIPRAYYTRLVGDLTESSRFVKMVVDRPLDVFRSLVLFLRPAYYVNNVAGQNLMLAVRDGGPSFVPAYIRFLAHRNRTGALRLLRQAAADDATGLALWDQVLAKHAAPLHGASAGQVETAGFSALTERMAMSGKRRQQVVAAMLRSPRTANELGAILSDDIPRQFRFIRLMEPHVKAAREAGETGEDAAIAMRLLDADPVLKERLIEQTLFDLVDYRTMSAFEKRVMRRIIPFYGWMRGLTVWALELGYNDPARFLVTLQLPSIVGQQQNAAWRDTMPTWLQGAFRVGGEQDGMQTVVNTQGLNPLATLGDVAMLTRAAFSEDPTRSLAAGTTLGQVNPYAQVFAAAAFNRGNQLGTGLPMLMPGQHLGQPSTDRTQWPGWIGTGIGGFVASTPQSTLWAQRRASQYNQQTRGRDVVNATGVYQSPYWHYLASFAGLPLRQVNLQAAAARRRRDDAVLAGEGGIF